MISLLLLRPPLLTLATCFCLDLTSPFPTSLPPALRSGVLSRYFVYFLEKKTEREGGREGERKKIAHFPCILLNNFVLFFFLSLLPLSPSSLVTPHSIPYPLSLPPSFLPTHTSSPFSLSFLPSLLPCVHILLSVPFSSSSSFSSLSLFLFSFLLFSFSLCFSFTPGLLVSFSSFLYFLLHFIPFPPSPFVLSVKFLLHFLLFSFLFLRPPFYSFVSFPSILPFLPLRPSYASLHSTCLSLSFHLYIILSLPSLHPSFSSSFLLFFLASFPYLSTFT